MASLLKVDALTGVTTAGSISVTGEGNSTTTNLQQGLAKHWGWFDTNTSNTVRNSFNNASITDNSAGNYTVAATNAFANIYSCVGCCTGSASDPNVSGQSGAIYSSTTAATFATQDYNGSAGDADFSFLSTGDLA